MSKLMSDLNNLSRTRRQEIGIVLSDDQNDGRNKQDLTKAEYKGIYFLSFLVLLLIGFSVLSLSISFKAFNQMESTASDTEAMLAQYSRQQKDIENLKVLMSENSIQKQAQIEDIILKVDDLGQSFLVNKDTLAGLAEEYDALKSETQESIDNLKASDRLMEDRYTFLNREVKKFNEENFLLLNQY